MKMIAEAAAVSDRPETIAQRLASIVERSQLQQHPFDHIYMDGLFAPDVYRDMLAEMPAAYRFHQLVHRDALRPDGSSTRLRMYLYPELLRELPESQRNVWVPVAEALCAPELEAAFKRKFSSALEDRFKKPVEQIRLYPIPILLRDQPGYRIGIHADVPSKAITVQFYLPESGAQRDIGTIFHDGRDGDAAARTTQMPFMPASGYAFPVSATKSWHSAAQTSDGDGERVSIMLTYYAAEEPLRRLKLRLRRSALRFGIHPKG
jgi:hypothetical protein